MQSVRTLHVCDRNVAFDAEVLYVPFVPEMIARVEADKTGSTA